MAKNQIILPVETLAEMTFPLQGLNVATVYDQQPPGTAPVGLNVRSYEALTSRARGGSRPGLSQYIPAQVDGAFKIQHLAVIVDPQAEALPGGTPPGDQAGPGRNATGGLLGYPPVRFPVEPGRTYPAPAPPPVGTTVPEISVVSAGGAIITFSGTIDGASVGTATTPADTLPLVPGTGPTWTSGIGNPHTYSAVITWDDADPSGHFTVEFFPLATGGAAIVVPFGAASGSTTVNFTGSF